MHHGHIFRAFPCCTLVGNGYSYPEANTVSNFKLSTPASSDGGQSCRKCS